MSGRVALLALALILVASEGLTQTNSETIPGVRFEAKVSASVFEIKFYVVQKIGQFTDLVYGCTFRDESGKGAGPSISGIVNRVAFKPEGGEQLVATVTQALPSGIATAQCRVVKLIR